MDTLQKEKIGVGIFGVCTLILLFFGIKQMSGNLEGPKRERPANALNFTLEEQFSAGKDTDADGLSDIEEQSVYATSAYIADTDSDGIDDGAEIAAGENPLCPKGQVCAPGSLGVAVEEPGIEVNVLGSAGVKNLNTSIEKKSPDEIRDMLIKAGAKTEQIEKLTDEQLQKLYEETVSSDSFAKERKMIEAFMSQDPAQIRALLKAQGISQEMLDSVNDEQLKELFSSALKQGQ